MFQIRKMVRFLFDNLNGAVHCSQPSPYTWAQLRGSDFGFQCFSATPLVFSQKIFDPYNFSKTEAWALRPKMRRSAGYQEHENLKRAKCVSGLERSDSF
jgi:hypothetical protein